MKVKELKTKTAEELKKILASTKEDLFKLNLERVNRKIKKVSDFKKLRHLVAQILTIMKEKETEEKNKES